jgi:hypothetical protein
MARDPVNNSMASLRRRQNMIQSERYVLKKTQILQVFLQSYRSHLYERAGRTAVVDFGD